LLQWGCKHFMVSFISKIFDYHTWGDVILESGLRDKPRIK